MTRIMPAELHHFSLPAVLLLAFLQKAHCTLYCIVKGTGRIGKDILVEANVLPFLTMKTGIFVSELFIISPIYAALLNAAVMTSAQKAQGSTIQQDKIY